MKKKKGSVLKIIVPLVICLVLAAAGGLAYYLYKQADSGLFFDDTVINGYDVSGMSAKEVLLILEEDYSAPLITVNENGEAALTLTLEQAGYTIDEMTLLNSLQKCLAEQNTVLLTSLMQGNSYEVEVPFDFDEETFKANVTASALKEARVASTNATLEFNGTDYYIEPETYGNELDDADLQVMVKDLADRMTKESRPQSDASLDIPESFYFLPEITTENEELNREMDIYNSYCKAKITLTFGDVKEELDWDSIQNWVEISDGEGVLLEDPIREYVANLAANYDTLYYERDFETTSGETIHFESADYGYQIDQEGETAQLIEDIYSNTEVTREPVYAVTGYSRNGRDDLNGTYVEANLSMQHLWFYKDGELVIETDFVSGLPTDERETVTGVFCIPYKKSPETLKGDTWEEEVTYWMPFYDGQGLHDAPWRSSFGGSIYLSNGSHGCINLPADAAKVIYDNMEERVAIFIYK